MTDMTIEQILDGAVEYINQHGWCRDVSVDEKGRACLLGAITACLSEDGSERRQVVLDVVGRCLRDMGVETGPVLWNDTVCRDADEAIHVLKRAKDYI